MKNCVGLRSLLFSLSSLFVAKQTKMLMTMMVMAIIISSSSKFSFKIIQDIFIVLKDNYQYRELIYMLRRKKV